MDRWKAKRPIEVGHTAPSVGKAAKLKVADLDVRDSGSTASIIEGGSKAQHKRNTAAFEQLRQAEYVTVAPVDAGPGHCWPSSRQPGAVLSSIARQRVVAEIYDISDYRYVRSFGICSAAAAAATAAAAAVGGVEACCCCCFACYGCCATAGLWRRRRSLWALAAAGEVFQGGAGACCCGCYCC
jgi:hypothetical protein